MAFSSLPIASCSQVHTQLENRLGSPRADQLLLWRQGGQGPGASAVGPGSKEEMIGISSTEASQRSQILSSVSRFTRENVSV